MKALQDKAAKPATGGNGVRRWLMLGLGLVLIWVMAYVVLPWGQRLPAVGPIMETIDQANIDAGAYWYTQSEETARAQMYVRNAIRRYD